MKNKILKFFRKKAFQPIWEKLHFISMVGMNYWGGANIYQSGEIHSLKYMINKLNYKDSTIIFDIGANIGQYALLVNELTDKAIIYSFEPSYKTYEYLKKNTKESKNIITHNIGFGNVKSRLNLYSSAIADTIASIHKLKNREQTVDERFCEEIELDTIDSFCSENKILNIDILKVDIEGHELYALQGAIDLINSSKINFIQFEFSEFNIDSRTYFRDFYDLLSPNYNLFRIVSNGLTRISSYNESHEIFHNANYLAESKKYI